MDSGRAPSAPPSSRGRNIVRLGYQSGYNNHQPLYAVPTTSTAYASGGPAPPQLSSIPQKNCEIKIRDHPHRAIAIVSGSHALILRHSSNSTRNAVATGALPSVSSARPARDVSAKVMAEFTTVTKHTLDSYRNLTHRNIFGTLGLIAVEGEVFLCVVTQALRAAAVRPGENVESIASVAFFCLSSADWDDVVSLDPYDQDPTDYSSSGGAAYGPNLGRREIVGEHPCHSLQKLISNGSFYYSTDFDVTNRCQDRPMDGATFDMDTIDDGNLWNGFMIEPLVRFRSHLQPQERTALDASKILTLAFRGYCRSMTVPYISAPLRSSSGMPSSLTIISRLSSKRAGTRFLSRGIDDDGNVANFVESETTYWSASGVLFSYAQVRGSVPVFWEQATDLIPGRQKITVTRSPEGTQPAFDQHFQSLAHRYGAVHAINLLSEAKPGEAELSYLYSNGVENCPLSRFNDKDHALLRLTHYDFHAETKGPAGYEAANEIRRHIENSGDSFAYYLAEENNDAGEGRRESSDRRGEGGGRGRGGGDFPGSSDGKNGATDDDVVRMVVVLQQEGVFRTNCLDCLDRTNLIQTIISRLAVETFLGHKGVVANLDFWSRHGTLWADNGDALSKIYAGTGALKTSFTRHGKASLSGALADMRKSVQRLYHNNFVDPGKQVTIEMLLGRLIGQTPVRLFDPISDFVSMELRRRRVEFTSSKDINIFVGTYNVNGRSPEGINDDLSLWLCPQLIGSEQPLPEIVAIGFQEIVELSPQHIVNTDPGRKHVWEQAVKRTLNENARKHGGEPYVLLRSGQLVGAALCIFVTLSALKDIKNVEGSVKKTGMSGMAGNKGAVAIRMDYVNTQICFVTAHLAAGFSNYDDRNRDYAVISEGLRFQRNRGIVDHDTVIWLGDFNYRIGLDLEAAKALVRNRDLDTLYANDQLNIGMVAGLAFHHYAEARITFLPTYKYDIGTDDFDTSEKQRIPAWTDRILRKGSNLRQLSYDSAPLKFSDHKPVYATFRCTVSVINEAARQKISNELYERRKADVGKSTANEAGDSDTDDEDLVGFDSIEPGLPPPSSDRQKWWLDNDRLARSTVSPPKDRAGIPMALNPRRPSNPFVPTEEHDWVSIPRSPSHVSVSTLSSSPYEHVNMSTFFSTSASSAAPRRPMPMASLPLSNNPQSTGSGGRSLSKDEDIWDRPVPQATAASSPPPTAPPPLPRRNTTRAGTSNGASEENTDSRMSTSLSLRRPSSALSLQSLATSPGNSSRHTPPPVARKPAHLSSTTGHSSASRGDVGATGAISTAQLAGEVAGLALLPRQASQTGSSTFSSSSLSSSPPPTSVARTLPPAPPKSASMSGARALPGMTAEPSTGGGSGGPIPQKPVAQDVDDLLGSLDEGDAGLLSWNTLRPETAT